MLRMFRYTTNMEDSGEIWRPVAGYDGKYEVSNRGRVRSLWTSNRFGVIHRTVVLSPKTAGPGYLAVNLTRWPEVKTAYIHRLVCQAFCDNPRGLNEVNHKNLNKRDNGPENLEWCTRSENIEHAIAAMGTRHPCFRKVTHEVAAVIRSDFAQEGATYESVAKKHGLNQVTIRRVIRGEYPKGQAKTTDGK